jgi:hypothetical protein
MRRSESRTSPGAAAGFDPVAHAHWEIRRDDARQKGPANLPIGNTKRLMAYNDCDSFEMQA